jgi:aryl-alcohol dehydrogenase-like predicted oxidoreductase
VCTKFGHDPQGKSDFSAAGLRPSVEASLKRLQTDRIEVLLMHNPKNDVLAGQAGAPVRQEFEKLKKEGKVRAYGASVDTARDLGLIAAWDGATAAEILFNAFHQEPRRSFAAATARGVGLIVKVPLDSGWLSGKYHAASQFQGVRERWSPQIVARRAAMVEKLKALLPPKMSLAEMALKFILAHGEISTLIPGGKSFEQVKANCKASDEKLDAATVAAIKELWERELAENPLPW